MSTEQRVISPDSSTPDRPRPGFGGVTSEGFIFQHWTWVENEYGDFTPDKYVGPGPLINKTTGEIVPRNRPGSTYVEADIYDSDQRQLIEKYARQLQDRAYLDSLHASDPHYAAPEQFPTQVEIEQYMLSRFTEQDGRLNYWDAGMELMQENGAAPGYFEDAADNFRYNLDLEVKAVDINREEAVLPENASTTETQTRRAIIKIAGTAVLLVAGSRIIESLGQASYPSEELAPNRHTVNEAETLTMIVKKYYPDMSDEEIDEYIYDSGKIINVSAKEDENREDYDPDLILVGDFLELSQP